MKNSQLGSKYFSEPKEVLRLWNDAVVNTSEIEIINKNAFRDEAVPKITQKAIETSSKSKESSQGTVKEEKKIEKVAKQKEVKEDSGCWGQD